MWKRAKRKSRDLAFEFDSEYKVEHFDLFVMWNKVARSSKIFLKTIEIQGVVALDPPDKELGKARPATILKDIENPARFPYIEVLIKRKKTGDPHRLLIDRDYWGVEIYKHKKIPLEVAERAVNWQLTRTEMFLIERAATDYFVRLANREPGSIEVLDFPKRTWYVVKDRDQFFDDGLYNISQTWPNSYPCLAYYTTRDHEYLFINGPDNPESVLVHPGL